MYLENCDPALEVGAVHNDPPVKTAGTKQGLVQDLRAVGRADNQDTLGGLEAVHLGQELVQGLLTLLISSAVAGITAAADGVDLIDKNNAGSIFIGFFKKVAHSGRAHADIELDEIRAREGEKRHVRLAGNSLGQQGLAGSGRAYQQGALGKLGSDLDIAARVVQEIDDLDQGFLGLVLARDILKGDTGLLLHIFLGRALADTHDAAPAAHAAEEHTEQPPHQNDGEHVGQQEGHDHSRTVRHIGIVCDLGLQQPLGQRVLGLGDSRVQHGIRILEMNLQPVGFHIDFRDLLLLDILDEFIVGNLARITVAPHEITHAGKGDDRHQQKNEKVLSWLPVPFSVFLVVSAVSAAVPVISVFAVSSAFTVISAAKKIKPADQACFLIHCAFFYHMYDLVLSFRYCIFCASIPACLPV